MLMALIKSESCDNDNSYQTVRSKNYASSVEYDSKIPKSRDSSVSPI